MRALAAILGTAVAMSACGSSSRAVTTEPTPSPFDEAGAPKPDAGIEACAGISLGAGHRPLDLFVMIDRSYSMDGAPWDQARVAMKEFFRTSPPTDVTAALNYFPNDADDESTCNKRFYQLFPVGLGPLPAHAAELAASLDATNGRGNGTPTGIAVEGGLITAVAHRRANPGHRVALVLVSDGFATTCTDNARLMAVVTSARAEEDTLTFAIGIGGDPIAFMNSIAAAGGTGQALKAADTTELGDKLREAQVDAVGCEFLVPKSAPDGQKVDPNLVNVVVTDSGGARTVPKYADLPSCAGREGWYYDDPANPSTLRLCPVACNVIKVKAKTPPAVDVTFGCVSQGPR